MLDLETLDPGIRRTVAWLRAHGFNTTDSGDGVTKLAADPPMECALDYPHVAILVEPHDLVDAADRLLALLLAAGVSMPVPSMDVFRPCIEASYCPVQGAALIVLCGVNDAMLYPG